LQALALLVNKQPTPASQTSSVHGLSSRQKVKTQPPAAWQLSIVHASSSLHSASPPLSTMPSQLSSTPLQVSDPPGLTAALWSLQSPSHLLKPSPSLSFDPPVR
jgi:hypothetical protein